MKDLEDNAYTRMIRADQQLTKAIQRNEPNVKIRACEKSLEDARRDYAYTVAVKYADSTPKPDKA